MSPIPNLSRLGLGTVQWGLQYGVANVSGQPSEAAVEAMLRTAHECGVNWLDTARAYGESEQVIGRALRRTGLTDHFTLATKTAHLKHEEMDGEADVRRAVEESVLSSLAALHVEHLPFYLVHNTDNLELPGLWEELLRQKQLGRVGRLGVSISARPVEIVDQVLKLEDLSAVQVALNILDQRLVRSGTLERLADAGVTVFARSVYLQGLLVMPENAVPEHLQVALPWKRRVSELAEQWQLDSRQLAVQFVLGLPGVRTVVLGCETVEQVRQNAELARAAALTAEQMKVLREMPEAPPEVVEPWLWTGATKPKYNKADEERNQ